MCNRILAARTSAAALTLFLSASALAAGPVVSSSSTLPPALQPALYAALAKDAGPAYVIGKDGCATLKAQHLTACFDNGGVRFSGKDAPLVSLHLAAYGRGTHRASVKPVLPTIQGSRASYAHRNVTEWWRVLPVGFEQGFTVTKRPAGKGDLTLELAANRKAATHGDNLAFGKLDYGKLVVTDAKGHVVPATLTSKGDRIVIAVNDTDAVYPLTVDPLVWIEQKVTASDGEAYDYFGLSVAVDGTVAMVGSPYSNIGGQGSEGAVYVYDETGGSWTFVQKLTASDGATTYHFGASVALHGAIAVIGTPNAALNVNICLNCPVGAAYVFTESGGTWSQAQKLSANDGVSGDQFGAAVALDGTTVLVGAPGDYSTSAGAAYVFTQSGGTWSQVQKLTQSDTDIYNFGAAVAVDGTNALVGAACGFDPSLGDCTFSYKYAFVETDGTWNQIPIAPTGGSAVALSGDTAVATNAPYYQDPDYGYTQGYAKIYTFSNGTWTQNAVFYGNYDGSDDFGVSAAIADNTVLVGADYYTGDWLGEPAPGEAFEYTNSNGTWAQTQVFTASDGALNDFLGDAVAVSGDNDLFGAWGAVTDGNNDQGAAYFEGQSDLDLALSAPASVGQGQDYLSQSIVTNNATAASPAVAVTVAVPAPVATFVSATATQGSCTNAGGTVTCAFGAIAGNGGTATANVTLQATGGVGETIENAAGIAKATPTIAHSLPTQIVQSNCDAGYSEYDGTLGANAHAIEPDGQPYAAPAGMENGVLTAPGGFQLYVAYHGGTGGWHLIPAPGNALHRNGPAGSYAWIVKAGSAGGAFTFCLEHP